MQKEIIIRKMQKPARILKVIAKILMIFSIIGAIIGALCVAILPNLIDFALEALDSPNVEQTTDIRETIAMLEEIKHVFSRSLCITMTVYVLLGGALSVMLWRFVNRLFSDISEERYSLMRPEYARAVRNIAITLLASFGVELIFESVLSFFSDVSNSTYVEISTNDTSLTIGLILLAISVIYKYACILQLMNEDEEYASSKAEEEKQSNSQFEGF